MTKVDPYIADQIVKFWRWWAEASPRIHSELSANQRGREFWKVGDRLARVDRKLRWEITPGTSALHRLTLRPLGDPDRRHLARLLLAAAPPADIIWEYAFSRAPSAVSETIELGSIDGELIAIDDLEDLEGLEDIGVKVEHVSLDDMRVLPSWDPDLERASISFWHPMFTSIGPDEAYEIGQPAIANLLGDEDELRRLGELRVDPALTDGMPLPELRAWIDQQALTATGNRWITERRRDQRKRHVAVRFNAAQKPMDLPPKSSGLAVVLQRAVADVEAPETREALGPLDDLISKLDPATVRLIEVSESKRLTVYFISADPAADKRAVKAWERRHPKVDAEFEVKRRPKWTEQLRLGEPGRAPNVDWDSAPVMRTRGDGRLYRRARWIERNPRRLLAGPLLVAIGAIILGLALPSAAHEAGLLLVGVAGVTGVLIATYMASSTYVTVRNNAALGCIALLIDGWRILVLLGFSLALIVIYLDEVLTR